MNKVFMLSFSVTVSIISYIAYKVFERKNFMLIFNLKIQILSYIVYICTYL
jgi:hypothetical protein